MQMLYDSDTYCVVHVVLNQEGDTAPRKPSNGFEIVCKTRNQEVLLHGQWADIFQRQINAWQIATPTQDEVEEMLESYAALAQYPLVMH